MFSGLYGWIRSIVSTGVRNAMLDGARDGFEQAIQDLTAGECHFDDILVLPVEEKSDKKEPAAKRGRPRKAKA